MLKSQQEAAGKDKEIKTFEKPRNQETVNAVNVKAKEIRSRDRECGRVSVSRGQSAEASS